VLIDAGVCPRPREKLFCSPCARQDEGLGAAALVRGNARCDISLHFGILTQLRRQLGALLPSDGKRQILFSVAEISQPKPPQPVKKDALNS
jgi:hypothetical protein